MSIFQKSIFKNIKQDESLVATRWAEFQKYIAKIDAIKDFKEEVYQDGFFKDIFENCLGYTLKTTNPNDFNLEREKKNETDGKKADGVLYVNGEIIGVVELKDQKTKNLDAVETQAFNYHASHSNSKYIIISNFDELRFYIDKKTAYEKFSLFCLSYEEFKKLHLLMSYESIKADIPLQLKEKSAKHEQQISKDLYKDFSLFRTHLFENMVKNNDLEKSLLLRLTQKLCDRIIFILFAEDRGLLTLNTIKEIREKHKSDGFGDRTMYDYYKLYFTAINEGNERLGIPKYNGGLFAKDELLDSIKLDDFVLDMEAQKLSDYDFLSDVSVNILGHIFEQSLTDLEEISATIDNVAFDAKKSKRKKDGVFYTPEYITRYIVENTLGKLCKDKREELKLTEITAPQNPKKPTKKEQEIKENLEIYRDWLLHVKVLDPACGSGAFLNQALDFLIKEHESLQKDLVIMGDITAYYEIEKSILEHNLYGVDINEDAVEIAKLSLWLRTASKGRELTTLADKIVCANSLLEMPFPEGSFDVVIGNPPYIRHEKIKVLKSELAKKYKVYTGTADIFVYFYELAYKMLKPNGVKGFICSNKFFTANYGKELRSFILDNMCINTIVNFTGIKIFEDATVDSSITIFQKSLPTKDTNIKVIEENLESYSFLKQSLLTKLKFSFSNPKELIILQKIESIGTKLKEWDINIYRGIQTGNNDVFIIDESLKNKFIGEDKKSVDIIKPILQGKDISRYSYEHKNKYLLYITDETNIEDYIPIYEYLKSNKYLLDTKVEVKQGKMLWYVLYRPAKNHITEFEKEKIVIKAIGRNLAFSIAEKGIYISAPSSFMTSIYNKYIIAILSSNLIKYFIYKNSDKTGAGDIMLNVQSFEQIPIAQKTEEKQQPFIKLVDEILETKPKIKDYKILLDEALHVNNFDREIKLKKEIETFEKRVIECENEIDKMVYKLYDLSEDEIKFVEGN